MLVVGMVVPDMRVIGIGAEAMGAFRDEVELSGQVCFGGKDSGASFSGLVGESWRSRNYFHYLR